MKLIDGNALIKQIDDRMRSIKSRNEADSRFTSVILDTLQDIVETIEDAEEVEAEPVRHGWWVEIDMSIGYGWYECSECKRSVFGHKAKYCPECGAKMDAKEEPPNA